MRVFWWSSPEASQRVLRTANLEDGQFAPIDQLNGFALEVVDLLANDAHEISWGTAQTLGWPT